MGLADVAVVKANQLMPKPTHLTWEEAAINALCNSTAYRMLVSHNGARMTQGDKVLVWGASGGLGSFAVQHVLNGGGTPIGVVSSPEKVALLNDLGVEAVIDRRAAGYKFWKDEHTQDESEWRRLGKDIRGLVGGEPEIVFEHPGRQTMGASVFACKRGGTIVTCAATSGFMIEYDNRHLWMKLKTIKGSHFANYREAWDANQLVCDGKVLPPLSAVYTLENVGEAAYQVHHNLHEGKIGVLCLAPEEGLGIDDQRVAPAGRRRPHHALPAARGMSPTGMFTEIDHVAIAVTISRRPSPGTGTSSGPRWRTASGSSPTGSRKPCSPWPTRSSSCSLRPGTTRRWRSTWPTRARACTMSATGWRTAPRRSSRSRTPAAG